METHENINSTPVTHTAMDHPEDTGISSTTGHSPLTSKVTATDITPSPADIEIEETPDQPETADIGEISPNISEGESHMALMGAQLPPDDPIAMMESPPHPEGNPIHHLAMDGPHPETAEIIRQVEFYFGDENLPNDSHLLSFAGASGDGWVSLNRVLGFKKMRRFRPARKAKEALRNSTFVEVDEKLQYVRRKTPLNGPTNVSAKQSEESRVARILIENPHLSKGMLKPTGFETGFTEGPMKPEEVEQERKLFDPEEAFTFRIESAVARYMSKRKLHQDKLNVFSKFLIFGGFDGTPRQFTGSFNEKDLEDYTKDEIVQMKASFGISERVVDGLEEDQEGGPTWVVDFEGMAKAFFSSQLLQHFDWLDENVTNNATNVIINFYNYLLYHEVCPEYKQDLINAREVCFVAQKELPKLATAACGLPGGFNTACSTLFGGYYAERRPTNPHAEWVNQDDDLGWSDEEAKAIWHTAIVAHCTSEQYTRFEQTDEDGSLTVGEEHQTGLEIIEVELPSVKVKALYGSTGIEDTFVRPTGKIFCKRWIKPGGQRLDIPKAVIRSRAAKMPKRYEFLVEEDVLRYCYPGMKLEATVMKFSAANMSYLDRVHYVYPSFFTWTLNERIRELWKSGPIKDWMRRQNEKYKSDDGSFKGTAETVDEGSSTTEVAENDGGGNEVEGDGTESTKPVFRQVDGGEECKQDAGGKKCKEMPLIKEVPSGHSLTTA